MEDKQHYIELINEIIQKQSIILGPEIAILKARNTAGLKVSETGSVTDIEGDPHAALQSLIDQYVSLAGQIVKNALGSIFQKYPNIKQVN
jgi:hypothetical protein